ncbi:MAG: polyprenyl synthetase family protein [Saprospiraceae bacterium]|nr:polyprenyl synthetase family protein [Saprospiraceae bacterium]
MPTNPDDDGKFKRHRLTQAYEQFNRLSHAGNGQVPFFKILDSKVYSNDGKRVDLPMRWRFAIAMHAWMSENGAPKRKLPPEFFEQQLPFILEVIISVQYYHNQILDRKGGVTTHAAINDNLIMGNLLKDQLYRYIDNLGLEDTDRKKVVQSVRSIFEYVDIGQYIEKSCNTYEAYRSGQWSHPFGNLDALVDANCIREVTEVIQSVHPINRTDYLHIYLQRIYLTNAILFKKATTLIATLLEVDQEIQQRADQFAGLFGMMQQVVNDNCDFVPSIHGEVTIAKNKEDAFCDLKNKLITLPLLIYLQRRQQGPIYRYLESVDESFDERACFNDMTRTTVIYYALAIVKKVKKLIIKKLDDKDLSQLCEVADNNRFYKYYYDEARYYNVYRNNRKKAGSLN